MDAVDAIGVVNVVGGCGFALQTMRRVGLGGSAMMECGGLMGEKGEEYGFLPWQRLLQDCNRGLDVGVWFVGVSMVVRLLPLR